MQYRTNVPAAIGVLVVHNKLKPKKGTLPADVTYIAAIHIYSISLSLYIYIYTHTYVHIYIYIYVHIYI